MLYLLENDRVCWLLFVPVWLLIVLWFIVGHPWSRRGHVLRFFW